MAKSNKGMKLAKKFAKRREEGKTYEYKPNPFPKGSEEYILEQNNRRRKNAKDLTTFRHFESVMGKLDYRMKKHSEAIRKAEMDKRNSKCKAKDSTKDNAKGE